MTDKVQDVQRQKQPRRWLWMALVSVGLVIRWGCEGRRSLRAHSRLKDPPGSGGV